MVLRVETSVAGSVDGSMKNSLAWPPWTQLVTSRVWNFGKLSFPPGTTAIALPLLPEH